MTTIAPARTRVLWPPFVPYLLLSAVHVFALFTHNAALAAPTKLGLMPLLAIAVVLNTRRLTRTAPIAILLFAIFFSWLGDGAGTFVPFLPTVPMMLVFFGIAHLAYILLFSRHVAVRTLPKAALVFVLWWVAMLVIIGPHAGGLLIGVAIYGIVLGLTAATATRGNLIVLLGGVFFLISDTVLAFQLFMSDVVGDWTSPVVMLTYTLGQGLLAFGVLAHVRKQADVVGTSR
ncbi:lysoplasmalogenase family protein [Microbacterium sp. NC79]|uniref:lysoplasmalogenase family protein n=1 Tax=Microbacterium sp. NC79 TaxID=2851009 RepID=UPI00349F1C4D